MGASRTVAVAFVAALATTTLSVQPALGRRTVIGHSVRGRPIVAWVYGPSSAPRKVLMIGVIHGNEQAGLAIAGAERKRRPPSGVQVWIVPELNPDGVAVDTRQNAHGVDLNRNFPYRWQYSSDPTFYSGPRPASEPETRAMMRLVLRIRPAITVTFIRQHIGPGRRVRWGSWRRAPVCAGRRHARNLPDVPAGRGDRVVQSHAARHHLVRCRAAGWPARAGRAQASASGGARSRTRAASRLAGALRLLDSRALSLLKP